MQKIIDLGRRFIEWVITQYLRVRPKKTYWTIAVPFSLFFLGELTKLNDPFVKYIEELSAQAENPTLKVLLKLFSIYLSFEIPSWILIVLGVFFGIITFIKILDSFGNRKLRELIKHIEEQKLTPEKVKAALITQNNRQLQKQINSGKYIPNTFIEVGNHKDYLRYFSDPIFFASKCFQEIEVLDFRHLNNILEKSNHPRYSLEWENFRTSLESLSIDNHQDNFSSWLKQLISKKEELKQLGISSNETLKFELKFRNPIESLSFLKSKVVLITETAGQGKTNFVCDFTENFLSNRNIPIVFLTGVEVNENDIRKGIISKVFPDTPDVSFKDFINCLGEICKSETKFFNIIIDGINENSNTGVLSSSLEQFISEILEYDFIRIILTCRTEYYRNNFLNLEKSTFKNEIQFIDSLIPNRPDDEISEKLFDIYFEHFNIQYSRISNKAYNQLVSNFLLLRIFCETYSNQEIDFIDNIYKDELFHRYYTMKCDEINNRLSNNDEFNVSGNIDIRVFLQKVVSFMVANKQYVNIPLDSLLEDNQNRAVYVRFLDENVLIKRDPKPNKIEVFGDAEVVNFTFDEFRDFLISQYLVEKLFPSDQNEFTEFLTQEITKNSPILEGCSTFLFHVSRRLDNEELQNIISSQDWFEVVFTKSIFSLNDTNINEEDLTLLKGFFLKGEPFNHTIIWNLILRYDLEHYSNLNIQFLFSLIKDLDEDGFKKCFLNFFGSSFSYGRIRTERLLDQFQSILERDDSEDLSHFHNLFELLIYLFDSSWGWKAQEIYEQYNYQNSDVSIEQLKRALECKNEKLHLEIFKFIEEYEIAI